MSNIPSTPLEKTLSMRLQHTLFRLNEFIASLRLDARWVGNRTAKYLLSNADALEELINEIKTETDNMEYEVVE